MTNESKSGSDHVLNGTVRWDLGIGNEHKNNMIWRCDGLLAGKLYSRSTFGTREEAEKFVHKMRRVEPDQMFSVEGITASTLWN